jgi:hypothetical protein
MTSSLRNDDHTGRKRAEAETKSGWDRKKTVLTCHILRGLRRRLRSLLYSKDYKELLRMTTKCDDDFVKLNDEEQIVQTHHL